MRVLFFMLFCWWGLPGYSPAALLVEETFDFPDAPLVNAPGSGWFTHSGTTGQLQVLGGRAVLSYTNSEDASILLPGGPYSASTNTEFYAGMILQLRRLPSGAGDYLAHFKNTGSSGYAGKLFVSTNGAASGTYRLGVSETANTAVYASAQLSLYTDYFIVLRYTVSNANTVLWIEPSSESPPTLIASDAATPGTLTGFALRQSGLMGIAEIDALRVGASFNDVLLDSYRLQPPMITQPPAERIVTEGDSLGLQVGAAGAEPLFYQWLFSGTNLSGASTSSLRLEDIQLWQAGEYSVMVSNRAGFVISSPVTVAVNIRPRPAETLTVLAYNLKGNGVADWSTNSLQVQAIGRQMALLQPDILALNEIPYSQWWQMTNFAQAWLPGYFVAANSGTDGYVRSVVLSRWPFLFSRSWLDGVSLEPFGSTNRFARDLFHAQVAVPFFPQPLNVFVTHLKATTSEPQNDALRRGAEAAAVSNFLTTVWLPTNSLQSYVLCGDLNEDIYRPDTNRYNSRLPIQTLTSGGTGLRLTTPVNPYTSNDFTISIQSKLNARFDYVLPCALLWSNIAAGQVFRTDLLPGPPAPLLATDSATASDHLPVLLSFSNPYSRPFRLLAVQLAGETATLEWEAIPGNAYRVEHSRDLTNWLVFHANLLATNYAATAVLSAPNPLGFFRVYRQPPAGF